MSEDYKIQFDENQKMLVGTSGCGKSTLFWKFGPGDKPKKTYEPCTKDIIRSKNLVDTIGPNFKSYQHILRLLVFFIRNRRPIPASLVMIDTRIANGDVREIMKFLHISNYYVTVFHADYEKEEIIFDDFHREGVSNFPGLEFFDGTNTNCLHSFKTLMDMLFPDGIVRSKPSLDVLLKHKKLVSAFYQEFDDYPHYNGNDFAFFNRF